MNIQKREEWTPENELRIEVNVRDAEQYKWMEEFRSALAVGKIEMFWISGGSKEGDGTFVISKPKK